MDAGRTKIWVRLGLLNLAIVALYGTLMRYKIVADFPFFEQKNLLHAHSHFAFSAWISHLLYTGLSLIITPHLPAAKCQKYQRLIIANMICAFGMLIAFTVQGYKAVSITFSTGSIIVAILFTWYFYRDRRWLPAGHPSKPWAITGLVLNVLSSAGTFVLGYIMANKSMNQQLYLAAIYYYLHFQYNGWFFFGVMAIAIHCLPAGIPSLNRYFWMFTITVVPAFFLSVLWASIPWWLYVITLAAALLQLGAWIAMLIRFMPVIKKMPAGARPEWAAVFFYAAALALTIKFVLQAISVIPLVSQLVFGFRPIVIAYLHLVLLGVYSLFLLGYLLRNNYISIGATRTGTFIFLAGVLLNETLLAIQGAGAFAYIPIPYINEMLLGASIVLFAGALQVFLSEFFQRNSKGNYHPQG